MTERLFLIATLVFSLSACGGGGGAPDADSGTGNATVPPQESGPATTTATSWNDATWHEGGGNKALVWAP